MSRIEEDGRKWLGRPKLCAKSCRAVLRRRAILRLNLGSRIIIYKVNQSRGAQDGGKVISLTFRPL